MDVFARKAMVPWILLLGSRVEERGRYSGSGDQLGVVGSDDEGLGFYSSQDTSTLLQYEEVC